MTRQRKRAKPPQKAIDHLDRRLDIEQFLRAVGMFDRSTLEFVKVSEVVDDDRFQSRFTRIDQDALSGMREIMTAPEIVPPVIVVEYEGRLLVVDGRHRLYLAAEKKWVTVRAYVIRGVDYDEMQTLALLANGINGRTPNMGERRHHLQEMIRIAKANGSTEAAAIETYAPYLGVKVTTARNWIRVQKTVERLQRLNLKLPVHRIVPDEALRTLYQTTQDSWLLAVSKLKDEELEPKHWEVWSKLDVKKITKIAKQLNECQSVTERIDLVDRLWRDYQGPASIAGQKRDHERDQISTAVASCGNLLKLGDALIPMAKESPRLRDKLLEVYALLARLIPVKREAAA